MEVVLADGSIASAIHGGRELDSSAEIVCAIGYSSISRSTLVSNGLYYRKAVENPPIFNLSQQFNHYLEAL